MLKKIRKKKKRKKIEFKNWFLCKKKIILLFCCKEMGISFLRNNLEYPIIKKKKNYVVVYPQ